MSQRHLNGRFRTLPENIRRAARMKFRRYHSRCTKCWCRVILRQLPSTEKCPSCRNPLRVDWYRTTKREVRAVLCACLAWEFPHNYWSCRWGKGRAR